MGKLSALFLASLLGWLAFSSATQAASQNQPQITLLAASAPATARAAEAAALDVMYAFMRAFNSRDPGAFADTLLFPHVRIAGGSVTVSPTRETFIQAMDFSAFAQRFDWAYSQWDSIETIQADEGKVHFAVAFTRFNNDGQANATFRSLYILQPGADGWGIRARSSFAP